MYEAIKEWLLWLTRVPPEPEDPMGDVAALRVFRAAEGFWRYRVIVWAVSQTFFLITGLVVLIPLMIGGIHGGGVGLFLVAGVELLAVLIFPIQAFISYFLLRLDFEMRWYKITDRSLRIREGVLDVHEMTMTFANIQNISITQGPLERFFGISNVRVETAGGGTVAQGPHGEPQGLNLHVGLFRGVDHPEEIRDLMMHRLRNLRDTGLGDWDDEANREESAAPAGPAGPAPEGVGALLATLRDEAAALRRAAESAAARQTSG